MKIVIVDTMLFFPEHIKELQSLGEFVNHDSNPKDETEALERIKGAQVVINFWQKMDKNFLGKAKDMKMLCVAATGYDWIDVDAAKKLGITVCNCPGHNMESVAEHAVGLLLNAIRFASQAASDIKKGKWSSLEYRGIELQNKTLGVIGYGTIGRRIGEILEKGFGMRILSVNSKSSREELENLLKRSDFISINTPLNKSTRGMLAKKEFELMKKGVAIVNTGRGAVIDETALEENLRSGKVFAAGLDFLAKEPTTKDHPLLKLPNLVLTPHIAWNTRETDYRLSAMVVDNIRAFVQGKPINTIKQ